MRIITYMQLIFFSSLFSSSRQLFSSVAHRFILLFIVFIHFTFYFYGQLTNPHLFFVVCRICVSFVVYPAWPVPGANKCEYLFYHFVMIISFVRSLSLWTRHGVYWLYLLFIYCFVLIFRLAKLLSNAFGTETATAKYTAFILALSLSFTHTLFRGWILTSKYNLIESTQTTAHKQLICPEKDAFPIDDSVAKYMVSSWSPKNMNWNGFNAWSGLINAHSVEKKLSH